VEQNATKKDIFGYIWVATPISFHKELIDKKSRLLGPKNERKKVNFYIFGIS